MTVPAHLWTDNASLSVSEDRQFSLCMYEHVFVHVHKSTLEDTDLSSCGSFSTVTACMCRSASISIGQHVCTRVRVWTETPQKYWFACREPKANGSSAVVLVKKATSLHKTKNKPYINPVQTNSNPPATAGLYSCEIHYPAFKVIFDYLPGVMQTAQTHSYIIQKTLSLQMEGSMSRSKFFTQREADGIIN